MDILTIFTQYASEITEFDTIRAILPFKVIQCHRFLYQSKAIYDFLLVITTVLTYLLLSCTISEIQHSKGEKSLYLATPLAFIPPDGGGVPLGQSP